MAKHDYQQCRKGDDCPECKIAEQSTQLKTLAERRVRETPPTNAIKRAALNLLQQQSVPKLAALVLTILPLFGCRGLSAEGEAEVRNMIAGNKAIMEAQDAPQGAREVATDNYDSLNQLLYHEGEEDDVPPDVRARREARRQP